MNYDQILYDVTDRVATITLNRPEKLNAWTMRMGAEVRHAMVQADRDDGVRVIIVTGAGKGYCAGADMNMLQGLQQGGSEAGADAGDGSLHVDFDASLPAAFRGEYSYPLGLHKPVIAAVNGIAVGLGLSYMLYYDMRIASERARFGTIFSRRGLVAEHGSAWLLPKLIGMNNACDLLYSGRIVTAEEAQRMGLINRVVPHDALLSTVRELATEMATLCSPRSIRLMKRQLYGDLFVDLGASIQEADTEMVASFTTADFKEGVASFVQRRSPRFTGR
ncbi:MAG: enoyl-CoA hydratase/isomerase family protein [Deltaproteobacteria bacterium]|nr:enoyl-CoA hydratase/isomerase family protein [Deltaproteobacteria bacterium]MBI3386960.1 enoyl-CoA hydratase/isomerase family protein [Deltaproteobacteria bacterium]